LLLGEKLYSFAEYWIHFTAGFDGVHAFGYNSTGSEAIWMKIWALRVYRFPLALGKRHFEHWTIRLRQRCAICQITFTTCYLWTPT